MNKFTEEKFKSWLECKQDEDVVGLTGSFRHCPLAKFVQESGGYASAYVTTRCWRKVGKISPLPNWAKSIVCYVDKEADLENNCYVTAKELKQYYAEK